MALDGCVPCCSPSSFARSKDSYRQSKLIILCDIVDALGGGIDEGNTGCDPCCNPSLFARSEDTFRQSVLIELCQWLSLAPSAE